MEIDENTSDGHHSFKELYEHRHALFIALMKTCPDISWVAIDSNGPDREWILAGMHLPTGDISYHLPYSYWDTLLESEIPYFIGMAPDWDGHTPADVVDRLIRWNP